MSLDNQNCNPYFDECNGNQNISIDQLIKFLIRKDDNGCPAIPVTGNIQVESVPGSADVYSSVNTFYRVNDAGPFYDYGQNAQIQPIWSDNSGMPGSFQVTNTNNEKVYLKSGIFFIKDIEPQTFNRGRLHLFSEPPVVPNDDNEFNPSFAELKFYLGTLDFELKGYNQEGVFGVLKSIEEDWGLIPQGGGTKVFGVVEVNNNLSAKPNASITINLITSRPC